MQALTGGQCLVTLESANLRLGDKGMHTLVIADDEQIVRTSLRKNIKWAKYGFKVAADAQNGQEALQAVEVYKPDLLITDIKMPDLTGIEVLIRAKKIYPQLQVVMLSAFDSFEYARDALMYGAEAYLLKPVEISQLDTVMNKINDNFLQFERKNFFSRYAKREKDIAESSDIVENARQYIHAHYDEKITLEQVAASCHTSPSYLSTTFKARTGCSFVDYLVSVRMKKARELLEFSSYRIIDIAQKVGYEDYTYFCKVFKKENGKTPLEYRCENR